MEILNMWPTAYLNKKDKSHYLVETSCVLFVYNWGEVIPLFLLWKTHIVTHSSCHLLHRTSLFYTQLLNLSTVGKRVPIHSVVHRCIF